MLNSHMNPIDITIPLFLVMGITQLTGKNYVEAGIWIIMALGQFVVPKVGVENLYKFDRVDVWFTWLMFATFISLVIYQIYRDVKS